MKADQGGTGVVESQEDKAAHPIWGDPSVSETIKAEFRRVEEEARRWQDFHSRADSEAERMQDALEEFARPARWQVSSTGSVNWLHLDGKTKPWEIAKAALWAADASKRGKAMVPASEYDALAEAFRDAVAEAAMVQAVDRDAVASTLRDYDDDALTFLTKAAAEGSRALSTRTEPDAPVEGEAQEQVTRLDDDDISALRFAVAVVRGVEESFSGSPQVGTREGAATSDVLAAIVSRAELNSTTKDPEEGDDGN